MLTRQSPLRWTLPHVAHTGRNRPDGALSHTSSRSIHGACRTPSSASSRVRNVWTANRTRTRPMTHTRSLRRSHTSDRPGAISVPCCSLRDALEVDCGTSRSCSRPGELRMMMFSAAAPRGRRPPPRGELLDPLPPADQRSAAKEQEGSFRAPHGLDDERDRLIELAAYHRVKLEEKVPVKPKSVA